LGRSTLAPDQRYWPVPPLGVIYRVVSDELRVLPWWICGGCQTCRRICVLAPHSDRRVRRGGRAARDRIGGGAGLRGPRRLT
jgi:hypothetical protein